MTKTGNTHLALLQCYCLGMLGSAMPAALFYFYVRDIVEAEKHLLLFLGLYLVPGLVTLPLWRQLAQRFGGAQTWLAAMLFTVVVFSGVCFLGKGDVIPYGIICFLSGLTFGAEYMLPAMVLKNVIDAPANTRSAVARYATVAFLAKLMALLGCAPLFLFMGLFELSAAQHHISLLAFYGFAPCLLKLASAYLLWRWMKINGGNDEKPAVRGDAHAA